jgi:hypothetical protein
MINPYVTESRLDEEHSIRKKQTTERIERILLEERIAAQ